MSDREKVMSWLEGLAEPDWRDFHSDSEVQETARQALDLIDELLKEQKAQKFLVDESGKITPLPVVVRCKDCKNADYGTDEDGNKFMKCIGSVKCYGGTTPDFFCADGERRTDDA